jgi:nucleoside-diphosphate-sugar epimerase
MHVLVTGGCGYVGSALVPQLQASGDVDRITVLDNLENGSLGHLIGAPVTDGFKFRQGDVREYTDVESAMAGVDAVVHLAGITRTDSSSVGKDEVYTVNLDGTWNVLNAARTHDVRKVVFSSSSFVYGRVTDEEPDHVGTPTPFDAFTETKLEAEHLLEEFAGEDDRLGTVLRFGVVYGYAPGVRFDLPVNRFVFQALTDRPLVLSGDGSSWRPFVHVQDAAGTVLDALRRPSRWPSHVYDVGTNEEQYRLADVADVVRDEINPTLEMQRRNDESRPPSFRLPFEDVQETGFTFEWTIDEGVRDLADRFIDPEQQRVSPGGGALDLA